MEELIEQLLFIIDAQQAFIRKATRIISESQSVDDALRAEFSEESARICNKISRTLEG